MPNIINLSIPENNCSNKKFEISTTLTDLLDLYIISNDYQLKKIRHIITLLAKDAISFGINPFVLFSFNISVDPTFRKIEIISEHLLASRSSNEITIDYKQLQLLNHYEEKHLVEFLSSVYKDSEIVFFELKTGYNHFKLIRYLDFALSLNNELTNIIKQHGIFPKYCYFNKKINIKCLEIESFLSFDNNYETTISIIGESSPLIVSILKNKILIQDNKLVLLNEYYDFNMDLFSKDFKLFLDRHYDINTQSLDDSLNLISMIVI